MDTLSHFVFALLAGMAMGLHRRHKLTYVVLISFLAVLIDLDHFLVPLGYESNYRSMHSVYIAILLPFSLFLLSYFLERKTESDKFQTFFLLLTVMLTGHLIADMIEGPVKIFYPFSDAKISIPKINIQATKDFTSTIVGPYGVGMSAYAVIIFLGAAIHDTLYYKKKEKLNSKDALKQATKDYI